MQYKQNKTKQERTSASPLAIATAEPPSYPTVFSRTQYKLQYKKSQRQVKDSTR